MLLDIILISKLYVQQDDADENNIPGIIPWAYLPTVARAIINTTVGRSPSNVGKEKPKVNACCLGSFNIFSPLHWPPRPLSGQKIFLGPVGPKEH